MENSITDTITVKVGIVDDHPILTGSLAGLINNVPGFRAVLEAQDGEHLLRQLKAMTELPDILLMDIGMEGMDGIEATCRVTAMYPSIKIIALTVTGSFDTVLKMIKAGCCAYLKKTVTPSELQYALKEVYQKGKYHADIYHLNNRELMAYEKEKMQEPLTENEVRFIELTCKGLTRREMADAMQLSAHTIHRYQMKVFEKLQVSSAVMMVLEALRRDIIQLSFE